MPGARNPLERAWLAGFALACLCLARCGGDEFAAGGASGSAGSGSSGAGGSAVGGKSNVAGSQGGDLPEAGTAGDLPTGGSAEGGGGQGPTGDGGDGGAVSSGCNCPAGNYCKDATTDCLPCSALNRLRFSAPERLSSVSAAPGSRFPRVGKTSTDLFYRLEGAGLRYTTDWSTSAGSMLTLSQAQDQAPLLLSDSVTSLPNVTEPFNFAFDRLVEMTKRKLYFGQWQNTLQSSALAPAPFNGAGNNDYSPAIALHPTGRTIPRLFWMTDRDPIQGLVLTTAELALDAVGATVLLSVSVGQPPCPPAPEDLTPWVSEDGKTLLFSTQRKEAGCIAGTAHRDIYTTALQATTGQPPVGSAAIPLMDVNGPSDEVDPSFSADLCELYFASNRDNMAGYSLYRARRR